MYCYSNNGLSMRSVDDGYVAQAGEIIFSELATEQQIAAAFTDYNSSASRESILQQIGTLESSISPRMIQEALSGSSNIFSSGQYAGKTSAQVISSIRSQIDALRAQL